MPLIQEPPIRPRPSPPRSDLDVAFLIACRNGEATIASTVRAAIGQGDVYIVSDGSTDSTVEIAHREGAHVLDLPGPDGIGKPNALRHGFDEFEIKRRYDVVIILDDDTRVEEGFVDWASTKFGPGVAAVCGRVVAEDFPETRWNWLVNGRALAYWRYGWSIKRGQDALNSINVIAGSNTLFDVDIFDELIHRPINVIVDDTQWVLDIQTERLGRVTYSPEAVAYVQDPTNLGDYYRQMLRWIWGTFQGVRNWKIGRRFSWFDFTYSVMILDWVLYVLVWPLLAVVIGYYAVQSGDGPRFFMFFLSGYLAWSVVGAIGTRRWRLAFLFPLMFVFDQIQRVIFVHAFFKAWRQPTSPCIWKSPERVESTT